MNHILKLTSFVKPYWKRAFLALILLTSLVFMDLSIPRLIQRIIDQGIAGHNQPVIIHTALLMLGISVLSALFAIGNNILSVQVGESVARDLRDALFLKIQTFSFGNLDQLKTGQLMVRLTSDASALQRLTQVSLRIGTRAPLLMIGSLILMFSTDKRLALTILPLLLITLAVIIFFIVKMEPLFRSVQQKLDKLNTVLQENIAGVRLVKAFVRADFEGERFGTANFISYGQNFIQPLRQLANMYNSIQAALAGAERIFEIIDTSPEVQDAPDALPLEAVRGDVRFEHVNFGYQSDTPVIKDMSLEAKAGKIIALVGPTGAGKTTIINLLTRFYEINGGKISIDDQDIREVKKADLRRQLGLVLQDTFLFSDTVMENIRYGRLEATDEEAIQAAKMADADHFIRQLPQGYQTKLSERASNLSQGQRQLLAIARAILANPGILILSVSSDYS